MMCRPVSEKPIPDELVDVALVAIQREFGRGLNAWSDRSLARAALSASGLWGRVQAAEKERDEIGAALIRLDKAVEAALLDESALHPLDEVRGSIWATYNAASRVLKDADRRAIEAFEETRDG